VAATALTDHRRIKRLIRPGLGFGGFWTARRTLTGMEVMAMIRKGQIRNIGGNDIRARRGFIEAIDLYVWLACRLHVLARPIEIGWPALKEQLGEGYKELRFFRRDVLPSIELALAAYPEARVQIEEKRGLTLHPSSPPVPKALNG
jgi:hypothetical protein